MKVEGIALVDVLVLLGAGILPAYILRPTGLIVRLRPTYADGGLALEART